MKKTLLTTVLLGVVFLSGCSINNGTPTNNNTNETTSSDTVCDTSRWWIWADGKCYCNSWYTLYGRISPKCLTMDEFQKSLSGMKLWDPSKSRLQK